MAFLLYIKMGIFTSKTISPPPGHYTSKFTVSEPINDIFNLIELNKKIMYYKINLEKYDDKEKLIPIAMGLVNAYNTDTPYSKIYDNKFNPEKTTNVHGPNKSEKVINCILKEIRDINIRMVGAGIIGTWPFSRCQTTSRFDLLHEKYIESGIIVLPDLDQFHFYEYMYKKFYICKYFNSDRFILDLIELEGVTLPAE